MTKRKAILLTCTVALSIVILTAIGLWIAHRAARSANSSGAEQLLDQISASLEERWTETGRVKEEVFPFVLTGEDGAEITYYVCRTTCLSGELPEPEGLSPILDLILDPAAAENARPCQVSGLTAVLAEQNGRSLLCWTASAAYSFAIEYDPLVTSDADILRMAESVPANSQEEASAP